MRRDVTLYRAPWSGATVCNVNEVITSLADPRLDLPVDKVFATEYRVDNEQAIVECVEDFARKHKLLATMPKTKKIKTVRDLAKLYATLSAAAALDPAKVYYFVPKASEEDNTYSIVEGLNSVYISFENARMDMDVLFKDVQALRKRYNPAYAKSIGSHQTYNLFLIWKDNVAMINNAQDVHDVRRRLAVLTEECAICFEDLTNGDKVGTPWKCNHFFHLKCVQCDMNVSASSYLQCPMNECPICRDTRKQAMVVANSRIEVGQRVTLTNLERRSDLNGQTGEVVAVYDTQGRAGIKLDGGASLSVRFQNLV